MEAPLGMNSDIYLTLQEQLAKQTRVCVYDRAGMGLSDRPVQPVVNASATNSDKTAATAKLRRLRGHEFTVERLVNICAMYIRCFAYSVFSHWINDGCGYRMVDDLHRLITSSSSLGRPLMLVGSDMGAMIARFYAQLYPE